MATMSKRAGFALLACVALAGAVLTGCGGGSDGNSGGQGERVTDPAKVPSSTPIGQGAPTKYEIHQDGSLSVSGGPTVVGTPPANQTQAAGAGGKYTVKPGDTCGAIAAQFGITADQLIAENRATINQDCTNLHEGDELKIPGAASATSTPRPSNGGASTPTPRAGSRSYTVQPGDTCDAIARNQGVAVGDLIALNKLDADCLTLQPGQVLKIPG
jgi:LysM repeat protein